MTTSERINDLATLARLTTVLEAYGANPQRWPAAERTGLQALVRTVPEAHHLFAEAQALDRRLDTVPEPTASPELLAAVLGAAEGRTGLRLRALLWPFGPIWQPVCGLLLAAMLGAGLGQSLSGVDPAATADIYDQDYAVLVLGTPYDYVVTE